MPQLLRGHSLPAAPAATATDSALKYVGQLSTAWGVPAGSVPALQAVGEVPAVGAKIVRLRQSIDGLPIDRGEMRVMVRDNGELAAVNGQLVSADTNRQAATYPIDQNEAVARAVAHQYQIPFEPSALSLKERRDDGGHLVRGRSGNIDVQVARARKMWHHTGAMLVPAWIVEAYAGHATTTNGDAFRTVLTADGRRVLSHRSLVSDVAFNYRVFGETAGEFRPSDGPIADFSPHPTGTPTGAYPAFATSSLVSVDGLNHPAGSALPDPWLLAARTETNGNNVEAYTDLNAPTGFTFGDFRATTTATRTFDRAYDVAAGPLSSQAQQMAAITSAFYGINWLHDFWYDAGFTEAAGNGQDNNYGRGGEDRDAMLAETQDNALGGSLNNANMSTPADGLQPRMQIFVWTGNDTRSLTIQPANRTPATGVAAFGSTNFTVSAQLVLGQDGTGASTTDACEALTNTVTGRIVLVDRGNCSFKTKALNIQTAGGAAMLLANNAAGVAPPALGNDTLITATITIGSLSVTQEEGTLLKTELAGTVNATASRIVGAQRDGSLDSTLLAHEFGHYLHHRLQDCTSTYCSAQSEGWGDFMALMLMMRDGDNYDGAYPFSVYTTVSFSSDPAYFGIRRAPFSANQAINALSFRHMADGEALPTTHPILIFGNNAEVHNAGEVWAQTLQDAYVGLLKVPGATFTATRAKMAKYVVGGLLMSPQDATPTETRDAILAVATAEDRAVLIQGFARRGMGSCAVSAPRDSVSFVGTVESAVVRGRAATGAVGFDDSVTSCDDDHILDAGETAKITLPLSNSGDAALTNVTVTVTSTTPGVTVVAQPAPIASFPAGSSQQITVDVKLDKDVTGLIAGAFAIKVVSTNGCEAELNVAHPIRLNVDDVPNDSATDTFDADSSWKPNQATAPAWTQVAETALDRAWHGAEPGSISDTNLESPDLVVGTTPFRVTFAHKHSFEFDGTAWDGGVIELSTNNGASWADVSTVAGVAPGYSQTLFSGAGNPLAGRLAYGGTNPAYPATDTVMLDFGTALAGMTVKLRFRIGTDELVSDEGWRIDDLAVQGITNKPFPSQVEDRTACGAGPMPMPDAMPDSGTNPMPDAGGSGSQNPPLPPDEEPGCCSSGPIRTSNVALVFGVLGFLFIRRKRRLIK